MQTTTPLRAAVYIVAIITIIANAGQVSANTNATNSTNVTAPHLNGTRDRCQLTEYSDMNKWFRNTYGFFVYFGITILYNLILFSPLGGAMLSWMTGVQHVTQPGAMDRMIMRWPRVMLGTRAPVTAIQSLRCTLQGSTFFAGTALAIAMFSMLKDEDDCRRRLIYVTISSLLMAAVVFFAQQMRMVYHLNYMCSKRPKPHRNRNRMAERHHVDHDDGADRGAFLLSAEAEMTDAEFNSATAEFKHLQLECEMDLDDEAIRMSYVLQRAVMNHSLGFRAMLVSVPLILGLVNDVALTVATLVCIPGMLYYDVILAATRADPSDGHVRLAHDQPSTGGDQEMTTRSA